MHEVDDLINHAREARKKAYVPYSSFKVGAALRGKSGKVYLGCNIENASYSLTCCAERVAIFKALSDGESEFTDIAVIADTKKGVRPCGACRQVMSEFFSSEVRILLGNTSGHVEETQIKELLPLHFEL